jgi:hypothetical protein
MRLSLMRQASVRTPSGGAAAGCASQRSEPDDERANGKDERGLYNRDRRTVHLWNRISREMTAAASWASEVLSATARARNRSRASPTFMSSCTETIPDA